ncbi:MAG TPA: GTPase Era [Kofleriaceae bacterium]|nr:GTPase Era [Kofleriaceae bacterium]
MDAEPQLARTGLCAILGLPNAGKSTLLNNVLGVRLAAVSQRPQTTRTRILGVKNLEPAPGPDGTVLPAQVVFIDTPGSQQGSSPLRRYMQEQALAAAGDCDVALVMVDAADGEQRLPGKMPAEDGRAFADMLAAVRAPRLLLLNKVDRVAKEQLLPMIEAWSAAGGWQEIIPVSAASGDGLDRVLAAVVDRLPVGPRLFPEDMVTDRAERFLAGELVREQLFRQLGQEVPYATADTVESFEERAGRGDVVIGAVIHVERESQRPIVLGKGGRRIKEIGAQARQAISELLGCPVHLRLFVRVTPDWSKAERGLRDMGYE